MYPPESPATEKEKIPYLYRTIPVHKYHETLLPLQPLENCEEAIHGEWKTNRHRGKIFRAFAGLKANMTQIKSEILLYKIKEAYF